MVLGDPDDKVEQKSEERVILPLLLRLEHGYRCIVRHEGTSAVVEVKDVLVWGHGEQQPWQGWVLTVHPGRSSSDKALSLLLGLTHSYFYVVIGEQ